MAKELPYFKFEPAEYLTKNISFCTLSAQGLFINICSYYWQRNCKLTKEQLIKRLNYLPELNELISEGIIDLKDDFIVIKFLDKQLIEVTEKSKTNSSNGSKGGRPRKPKETEKKPNAFNSLSETKGIREEEIREDKIKEDNIKDNNILFKNKILSDEMYLQTISMQFKINLITVKNYIEIFSRHLILTSDNKNNIRDYKSHFTNWFHKQEITEIKPHYTNPYKEFDPTI